MTIEFDDITTTDATPSRAGRRVAAGLGAAMLVAAAGGVGFGIGRSADRSDTGVASGTEAEPIDELDTVPPPAESDEPSQPDDAPIETTVATDSAPADDTQPEVDEGEPPVALSVESSGGPGYSVFGSETTELLFDQTNDDGLTVRVHLGQTWDHEGYYDDGSGNDWQPPAWCYESGQVRLAIGGSTVIDVGSAPWYTEPYQGRSVSWLTLGRPDGAPHRVIFAQVPEGTANVSVAFGDGATASAAPQNGVVALAVPGEPETVVHDDDGYVWYEETPDFDLTIESVDGDSNVASDAVGTWNDPDFVASCSPPPPALPDPGEQPADPAADEATITQLMSDIYGEDQDEAFDTLDWIDDPTGVAEAREEVTQGSFEESAASAEAIVEELVFTAPDEAWFRYRIETSVTTLTERFGIARSVDGTWKITRDTICQDLAMASGNCVPSWEGIFPPSN